MTAPNVTLLPSLTVGVQPLVASTLATPTYTFEASDSSSRSYVLAGSLATVALSTVLAGCRNDPAPAPIPHESALPANQGNCAPGSRDPFCQGYRASVQEMRREREEGHHTDQALTGMLVGLSILLVGIPSAIMIVRRGRKIKRLEAKIDDLQPPTSGDAPRKQGLLSRLFGRKTPPAAQLEMPAEDQAAATGTEPVTAEIGRRSE